MARNLPHAGCQLTPPFLNYFFLKKRTFALDKLLFQCYIIGMMNEKQNDPTRAAGSQDHRPVQNQSPTNQGFDSSELDPETQRLIDAACEGVEVPSDEEVEITQQVQNWRNVFATDGGWPGDGSGMDDLADFNQMEGYDY